MKYTLCFLLAFLPTFVFGQIITEGTEREIARRIELEINPGISIGVLLPDGEAAFFNYGQYNKQDDKPDSLTLYEIGSVTKTFTAYLTNLYLESDIDATLFEVFPGINNSDLKKASLKALRNHTAGVLRLSALFAPEDWSNPFNGYSDEMLKAELLNLRIDTTGVWSYSNFGYGILGKALEKTTQKDFGILMNEITSEASMNHTPMNHQSIKTKNIAQPTNIGITNSYWNFTGPSRFAGGLISCTKDLVSYLKYQQRENPLFKTGEIEGVIQTGIQDLGEGQLFYKDGWFVLKPNDDTEILIHNGGTGGFTSFVGYNKVTRTGVVILSNSVSLVDDIGLNLLYPPFELELPERTIAYELAEEIEKGNIENIEKNYNRLKKEDYPDNILHVYWLERYFFGKQRYSISSQLSNILVAELPEDWEVHDINGQNLERLKKYKDAEKAYLKALELNPENEQLENKVNRCKSMYKK